MDIFNWIKDIEETYDSIIKKTDIDNQNEINNLKTQEQNKIKTILKKKQEFLKNISKNQKKKIDVEVSNFKKKINQEIDNMNLVYTDNKIIIIKKIFKELGFNF